MEPVRIELQAVNPARNCYRFYSILVEQDLFGYWLVGLTNGRIGSPGSTRSFAGDERDARAILTRTLRRRRGARGRIGVDYELKQLNGDLRWLEDVPLHLVS